MIGHALPVYRGYSSQYGHGLGNVLGGVVRAAVPFLSNLAKKAGTKLLHQGIDFLQQKATKRKASQPPKKRAPKRKQTAPATKSVANKKAVPAKKPNSRQKRSKQDIFGKL